MTRRLPLSAYDPRLLQYWLRGTLEPTLVAQLPEGLPLDAYRTQTGRLKRLAQTLHEVRTVAKAEKEPGWEALYSAILRVTLDANRRTTALRIEPRSLANDDLLIDPGPLPTRTVPAHVPDRLSPIPDDILADMFGPVPGPDQ